MVFDQARVGFHKYCFDLIELGLGPTDCGWTRVQGFRTVWSDETPADVQTYQAFGEKHADDQPKVSRSHQACLQQLRTETLGCHRVSSDSAVRHGITKSSVAVVCVIDMRDCLQDIAFYFVHWFTDLAGAVPTPLAGSEKFVLGFPLKVLSSFVSSFSIVGLLGNCQSETQVWESYLRWRWETHRPWQRNESAAPLQRHRRDVCRSGKVGARLSADCSTCQGSRFACPQGQPLNTTGPRQSKPPREGQTRKNYRARRSRRRILPCACPIGSLAIDGSRPRHQHLYESCSVLR